MNVKRYVGADAQELMTKIRSELGPDAVILSQRNVRKPGILGFFLKQNVEIMIAYEEGLEPPRNQQKKKMQSMPANSNKPYSPMQPQQGKNVPSPQALAAASAVAAALNGQAGVNKNLDNRNNSAFQNAYKQNNMSDFAASNAAAQQDDSIYQNFQKPAMQQKAGNDDELSRKVDRLSDMMNNMASNFSILASGSKTADMFDDDLKPYYIRLLEQEVIQELAMTITREAADMMKRNDLDALYAMKSAVMARLGAPKPIVHTNTRQSIVLLTGPTGVGKTTTLIKLAAYYSVKQNLKIGLINADTYRIGAKEQIATYAEILESPLSVVYASDGLSGAIKAQSDRDILFIDTAGKKPSDEKHKNDVQNIMEICRPSSVYLVISASTGSRAMHEIIRHYAHLGTYGLIITKVDETVGLGGVLNACEMSGMPISYITNGQKVPDDIMPADPSRIADVLLGADEAW